jgi:Spy/CpxP family protein refolding chaperone
MNNSRRLFVSSCFLLVAVALNFLASPVLAQSDPAPPQTTTTPPASPGSGYGGGHHGGMGRALEGINLSDQQKAKVGQVMQQYRQSHPPGSSPDPQARRQLRQQILDVLTPSQQAQYQQNLQRLRSQYEHPNPTGSTKPNVP